MRILASLLLLFFYAAGTSHAQEQKLRVGIFERPPFAMKSDDGLWTGIAVVMWDRVARELSLPFEFVELPESQALDALASGKLDVVMGEIAVSPERAQQFRFSQPYLSFPAAVALLRDMRLPHWADFLHDVLEHGVTSMLIALLVAMVIFSVLLWLVERRVNEPHFGGHPLHGFGSALWFAAVTMTTVGYGDKTPKSVAGRTLVFLWMFFGVVVISLFTGTVASSIALSRVALDVSSLTALASYHNGVVAGSEIAGALGDLGIRTQGFPSIDAGLKALEAKQINSFVAGEASLRYVVQEEFPGRVLVAPVPNTHLNYALGMRTGLPQRDAIDIALIKLVTRPDWRAEVERFIGPSLAR